MIDQTAIDRLFDWMCAGAPPPKSMPENVAALMTGLAEAGLPVARFSLFINTIHPTVAGKRITWTPDEGVRQLTATHEFFRSDYFKASPIRAVIVEARTLRRAFHRGDPADYEDLADLRDKGMTDYFAQPMTHTGGESHGMSWSTDAPGGFSDEAIAALERLNAPISRLLEIYTLKINTIALLSTYVGRNAGAEVLGGHIQRGDVERIPCAILFADLVGFTALSNAAAPEQVIETLNAYFGAAEAAIDARGGEILKFIGDGVLAIFPAEAEAGGAAGAALEAVDAFREALGPATPFRAALHVGEVFYGNIGGETRLDFTAIGPDVNLTARLLGEAAALGAETVCSAAFAAHAGARATPAGAVRLKGFADDEPIFRL